MGKRKLDPVLLDTIIALLEETPNVSDRKKKWLCEIDRETTVPDEVGIKLNEMKANFLTTARRLKEECTC